MKRTGAYAVQHVGCTAKHEKEHDKDAASIFWVKLHMGVPADLCLLALCCVLSLCSLCMSCTRRLMLYWSCQHTSSWLVSVRTEPTAAAFTAVALTGTSSSDPCWFSRRS